MFRGHIWSVNNNLAADQVRPMKMKRQPAYDMKMFDEQT